MVETSLKGRYGKMYVSEKTEGEIGKDDGGSFDNVVVIDWSRADLSISETSAFSRSGSDFVRFSKKYLVGIMD